MKTRIVEIDIFETTTDEEFEDVLSMIRILKHTCGARNIDGKCSTYSKK